MRKTKFSIHSIHVRIMIIFSLIFLIAFMSLVLISENLTEYFFVLNNKNVIIEKSRAYAMKLNEGIEPESARAFSVQFGGDLYLIDSQVNLLPGNGKAPGFSAVPNDISETMTDKKEYFNIERNMQRNFTVEKPGPNFEKGMLLFAIKLDNGNIMVVTKNLGHALEAGRIFKRIILYSAMVIYVIAFIAIYLVSKRISKPIIDAKEITSEFARLSLDKRLDEERKDEIGDLNRSINFMANELSSNIDELSITNEALNMELSKERTLDNMRRRFVSDVSHELKNPIAMIQGYADALMSDIPQGKEDKFTYYRTISEEAKHMNHIVKDLLDLSAYESGVFRIERDEFDIVELARNINARYSHHATEKNLKIIEDLPSEVNIVADRLRIAQVLINLLSNAYKHVEADGEVNVKVQKIDNQKVSITVANTGQLIPESELNFLFDSFYRVASDARGHGLGLAIVKSIIKLHDGSCRVFVDHKYNYFEVIF